ncbi:MAG: Ig-like domain-containing protein [Bacteroidota bacterium]
MNVSSTSKRSKRLILYLLLLLSPVLAKAQYYDFVQMLVNDTLTYPIETALQARNVEVPPNHGTAEFIGANPVFTLVYIPNTDYTGKDTMTIYYRDPATFRAINRVIEVEILAGFVTAVNDFATTTNGTAVTVDVLANDFGSGAISLSNVSLVNGGTAAIDTNNHVVFTPDAGFIGEAYLNYTVCDGPICDVGALTVFVEDGFTNVDTIYLATKRDETKEIVLPLGNGFQLTESPQGGSLIEVNAGIAEYTPNPGFFGARDTFTYAYNINTATSIATYIVDVLDTPLPNNFANDDFANVVVDGTVSVDVAANDNVLLNPDVVDVLVAEPQNGIAIVNGNEINYTPNQGFSGVDRLTYKVCVNNNAVCEDANVFIFVDNLNPAAATYYFTTPENTPLIVNYDVGITAFDFVNVDEESDQGGVIEYLDGNFDGEINGQQVSGFNLINYAPPVDFIGEDRFEFDYCVGNNCTLVKIVVDVIASPNTNIDTFCISDCVWPGDANRDGVVDVVDLLPIGYSVGEMGASRQNADVNWYGQFATDWNSTITASRVDLKNVDTDGDGTITSADTAAIGQSYGNTHNLTAGSSIVNNTLPLFFVPQNPGPASPGDLVLIDVILGNESNPAVDISGLTFALNFNSAIVKPGTFKIKFNPGSWLAYNSPTLDMTKLPFDGRAEAGISRTSAKSASGYGIIGTVEFVVEDIIDGLKIRDTSTLRIKPSMPNIMNGDGNFEKLSVHDLVINLARPSAVAPIDEKQLLTFPNPTADVMNVYVNGENEIRELSVYTLTGQEVFYSGRLYSKQTTINMAEWNNGLYLLSAVTDEGVITKKIEVMK